LEDHFFEVDALRIAFSGIAILDAAEQAVHESLIEFIEHAIGLKVRKVGILQIERDVVFIWGNGVALQVQG
jgi:hypothetical protein